MMPRYRRMYIRIYTRTSVAYTRVDPGAGGPRRGRLQHCSSHHPGKRVAMPTSGLPRPAARRGHTPFAHRSSLPLRPTGSQQDRTGLDVLEGWHWHAPLGRSTRHSDTGTRGQTDTVHGRPCRGLAGRARHELKGGGPAGRLAGWPAGRGLSPLLSSPPCVIAYSTMRCFLDQKLLCALARSDRHHMPAHTHRLAMISPSHGGRADGRGRGGPCDAAGAAGRTRDTA